MKYLALIVLLNGINITFCMEPEKSDDEFDKARKFVYQSEKLCTQYYTTRYELLDAIAAKDPTRLSKVIDSFPKQGKSFLINATIDYHNISHDYALQQKYPHFYAQKQREQFPFLISPLAFAVYLGDLKAVEVLHAHKVRMDFACDRKCILEFAAKYSAHLIPFLVACGAQVNVNDNGPIFEAARCNNVEAARHLLAAGANLRARLQFHNLQLTPLHVAGNNGSYEVAQLFLEEGAEVDATDPDGNTPLHWCIMNRKSTIASLLLKHGADITKKDTKGKSVIDFLSHNFEYLDAAQFIKNGAPYPESQWHQDLISEGLESGLTFNSPAYRKFVPAIVKGDTQTALAAIDEASGNELNAVTYTMDKYTFLHWATIRNNLPVINELLNRRSNQISAARNFALAIPLISRAIQHPVNIDSQDAQGRTPLMWAARLGLKQIFDTLKQAGANEMIKDADGKNAFLHAAQAGHMELALNSYTISLIPKSRENK